MDICLPAQDYFQVMILNEFPSLHGEAKFHQSGTKGTDAMIYKVFLTLQVA